MVDTRGERYMNDPMLVSAEIIGAAIKHEPGVDSEGEGAGQVTPDTLHIGSGFIYDPTTIDEAKETPRAGRITAHDTAILYAGITLPKNTGAF
jgi:hypothetical protein